MACRCKFGYIKAQVLEDVMCDFLFREFSFIYIFSFFWKVFCELALCVYLVAKWLNQSTNRGTSTG